MNKVNLDILKDKYNVDQDFLNAIYLLFDKLLDYGYISNIKYLSLNEKLLENIDEIRFGNKNSYDYKSGYYDANKKELYIKDKKNIEAIFLRILYVITTSEIDKNVYMSGYSITKLRTDSYRLSYENFGINRAIISNLVCKLCDTLPLNLQLVPSNKTYTHNFLGIEISSSNDIYSLEGKILEELCFVLDLDPEILYSGLFKNNSVKFLDSIFNKKKFLRKEEFLKLFDTISRKYNTYNKLVFLSNMLNNNYLEYKKHVLNDKVDKIKKEELVIKEQINNVLSKIYNVETSDEEIENEVSLSEAITSLEKELKEDIISIQDILSENIIKVNSHLPYSKYAAKLKAFSNILIVPNKKLNKELHETILFKLMPTTEVTSINLIQKIKYAIIQKILSESEFTNISNTYSFYNLTSFENHDKGSTLILLLSSKDSPRIIEVNGLDKSLDVYLDAKLRYVPLDNLKYAFNTSYSNILIGNVEELFTSLKNNFEEFNDIQLDNVYSFEYNNDKYLVVENNSKYYIVLYKQNHDGYVFSLLTLSENYKVFGKTVIKETISGNNLPILSKKK